MSLHIVLQQRYLAFSHIQLLLYVLVIQLGHIVEVSLRTRINFSRNSFPQTQLVHHDPSCLDLKLRVVLINLSFEFREREHFNLATCHIRILSSRLYLLGLSCFIVCHNVDSFLTEIVRDLLKFLSHLTKRIFDFISLFFK